MNKSEYDDSDRKNDSKKATIVNTSSDGVPAWKSKLARRKMNRVY